MGMWTAIVLIVIAAMAGEAWRLHLKSRSKAPSQQALDELMRRVDALDSELRDRVATLERIVIDDKADLKRKFDQLDKTG